MGVLTGLGRTVLRPPSAEAQNLCGPADCSITCVNPGDLWTTDPGFGVWLTVHAKPRLTGTSSEITWNDPGTPTFPQLRVIGSYLASGGGTLSVQVNVGANGICDDTEQSDPHDLIRCHDRVKGNPNALCGSWTGDNKRVESGPGGHCLLEVVYGFDFRDSITIDGVTFCWISSALTPLASPGLFGNVS